MLPVKFDEFACVGDSITWQAEGFTLRAHLEHDGDTKPTDFDCYSADDTAAWDRDEWQYVGVIVTASKAGVDLGDASLWGVDMNFPGSDNSYLATVAEELQGEAIEAARAKLAELAS